MINYLIFIFFGFLPLPGLVGIIAGTGWFSWALFLFNIIPLIKFAKNKRANQIIQSIGGNNCEFNLFYNIRRLYLLFTPRYFCRQRIQMVDHIFLLRTLVVQQRQKNIKKEPTTSVSS